MTLPLETGMRTSAPAIFLLLLWGLSPAKGQTIDLTELAIEDLLDIEVTSVSRHEQKLSRAASAVYVITHDDIRRSGVTTIPDALRMAPGVYVAQFGASQWAVSVRGFSGRFSDKLLVMVDGRSVYNPLFSGVYWDAVDVPLEDIDRIEVVRGPGGAVWCSNAVNGVVNIITRNAAETQGSLLVSGFGNREGSFTTARHGGSQGSTHYRMFSKLFSRRPQLLASGEPGYDEWAALRGGFRVDWTGKDGDSLMVSGDVYHLDADGAFYHPVAEPPYEAFQLDEEHTFGGHALARWSRPWSERSRGTLQVYHDRYSRRSAIIRQKFVESNDFDYQHEFDVSNRHRLMLGGGFRLNRDSLDGSDLVSFQPSRRNTQVWQMFLNDDFWLVEDKLRLTVGGKLEHNSYTGWQAQPSVSLLWDRGNNEALWASISRAVSLPSRINNDVRNLAAIVPGAGGQPVRIEFIGRRDVSAEALVAVEAGYRRKLGRKVSLDLALFRHSYSRLRVLEPGDVFPDQSLPGSPLVAPLFLANQGEADSIGLETALSWNAHKRVGFQAGYSFLQLDDRTKTSPLSIGVIAPRHLLHGRANVRLPWGLEWSPSYYFVDSTLQTATFVPAYHRVDSRLAWKRTDRWEISLGLQGLLDDRRIEGDSESLNVPQEIGRSVYGKITYQF